ncbi:MAG: hypothetical protein KDB00_16860, partial [Planctomycetales bacterium]|nr:hypothetical protein [Planctomycetales bacterium]
MQTSRYTERLHRIAVESGDTVFAADDRLALLMQRCGGGRQTAAMTPVPDADRMGVAKDGAL